MSIASNLFFLHITIAFLPIATCDPTFDAKQLSNTCDDFFDVCKRYCHTSWYGVCSKRGGAWSDDTTCACDRWMWAFDGNIQAVSHIVFSFLNEVEGGNATSPEMEQSHLTPTRDPVHYLTCNTVTRFAIRPEVTRNREFLELAGLCRLKRKYVCCHKVEKDQNVEITYLLCQKMMLKLAND